MNRHLPSLFAVFWLFAAGALATAGEFRHVGDYMLKSRLKLTGDKSTAISIKPMLFRVYTDGVEIRITADNDETASSTFEIYRSDGIGRQRTTGGAIEIIPGIQAYHRGTGGALFSHLRLSRESLTITSFPGVSDQTIVTHAVGVESNTATPPPAKSAEHKPVEAPRPESVTR